MDDEMVVGCDGGGFVIDAGEQIHGSLMTFSDVGVVKLTYIGRECWIQRTASARTASSLSSRPTMQPGIVKKSSIAIQGTCCCKVSV